MADSAIRQVRISRRRTVLPIVIGVLITALGLAGQIDAAFGYGALFVSVLLLGAGLVALMLLLFTSLTVAGGTIRWLFALGGWMYVFGVCALTGFYLLEGLSGRVELHWMLFGPVALAVLIVFDVGVYRAVIQRNAPTWRRYREHIQLSKINSDSMRHTFFSDVVFHSSLRSQSGFRWLRHTLILWGFVLMFLIEIIAVFLREGIPAFGLPDIWELPQHPIRLSFDFAFDFFGGMVLVGCVMAYLWRFIRNENERKFSDSPSLHFLFFVVISGFIVEGIRISAEAFPAGSGYSFIGYLFASVIPNNASFFKEVYSPLWYLHVFGSLAFIAYVPIHRLIHSCATPIGRLMNSQSEMLEQKRLSSLSGLLNTRYNSTQEIRD